MLNRFQSTRPFALCGWTGLFFLLTACGSAPKATTVPPKDETKSSEYLDTVKQLTAMNREAEQAYQSGKPDDAAKIMEAEKPLVSRVLSPPRPTLEAMEGASDLDQLYGTMLLKNRHYGWARMMFQENLARWKHWRPTTGESQRRLKEAEDGIAACDRGIVQ